MCSDFYPHAAVTQAFGIMREGPPLPGISERAVFIVDKNGKIVFAKVYPLDRTPDNSELLAALKKFDSVGASVPLVQGASRALHLARAKTLASTRKN